MYSLTERHAHMECEPSDFNNAGLPPALLEMLGLIINQAIKHGYLPLLHRKQHSEEDTLLLMVRLIQGLQGVRFQV